MERTEINFKKARDFGDLLSDTFQFLKLEFKPLIRVLLTYVGPFLLITGFLSGWYQSTMYENLFNFSNRDPFAAYKAMFSFKYFLVIISALVSNALLVCAIYSYIQLYITKGKDNFTADDVWRLMGKKFLSIFGVLILLSIIAGIGLMLCLVPGIYIIVAFSLIIPAMIFNDLSMGQAIERSMALIKDYWWFTFGIGIVVIIITSVGSYVFLAPQLVMSFIYGISSINGGTTSSTYTILLTAFTIFGTFGSSLLYTIPYTTLAFHYHSQIEKKESPNLINKINQINQPDEKKDSDFGF